MFGSGCAILRALFPARPTRSTRFSRVLRSVSSRRMSASSTGETPGLGMCSRGKTKAIVIGDGPATIKIDPEGSTPAGAVWWRALNLSDVHSVPTALVPFLTAEPVPVIVRTDIGSAVAAAAFALELPGQCPLKFDGLGLGSRRLIAINRGII